MGMATNPCLLLSSSFSLSFIQDDRWLTVPNLDLVTNLAMLLVPLGLQWTGKFWHESIALHYFIQAMMPIGVLQAVVAVHLKIWKISASPSVHLSDEAPKPEYVVGLMGTILTTFQSFADFAETVMVVVEQKMTRLCKDLGGPCSIQRYERLRRHQPRKLTGYLRFDSRIFPLAAVHPNGRQKPTQERSTGRRISGTGLQFLISHRL